MGLGSVYGADDQQRGGGEFALNDPSQTVTNAVLTEDDDASADGEVTVADPVVVLEQFLAGALVVDFDGDGDVDFNDVIGVLRSLDEGCPELTGGG